MILPMALLPALVMAPLLTHGAEPAWNEGGTITPAESLDSNTRIDLKRPLTLDISANHTVKLRGDISTPGPFPVALTKQGAGRLELWGNNDNMKQDVWLQGGHLHLAHQHALGDGNTLHINPGTALSYAPGITIANALEFQGTLFDPAVRWHVHSGVATQAGTIQRFASFVKTGAGTLALNNLTLWPDSRLAIDEGAVLLQGHFAGHIAVHDGAALTGSGRAGRLHVHAGGTLAPLQTLSVSDGLTFDAGSRLQLRAWPNGQVDQIDVARGAPQLNGDVLVLPQKHQLEWTHDTSSVIVKSDTDAIQGRFASVHSAAPWLEPTLHYESHQVRLQLRLRQGELSPINHNFSTGWAATLRNIMSEDSRFVREAVYLHAPQQNPFWVHALHSSGDFKSDNGHRAQRQLSGMLLGANHDISPSWRVGVYGGASRTHADGRGTRAWTRGAGGVRGGQTPLPGHTFDAGATLNTVHIGVHTQWGQPGIAQLVLGVAHSRHRVQSHRTAGMPLPADTLHSRYRARTQQVFAEARYPLWTSHDQTQRIEPLVRVAWVQTKQRGHTEQSHHLALQRSTDHIRTVYSSVGVHAQQELALPLGDVTLSGTLAWRHAQGDTHKALPQYFQGDPLQRPIKARGIGITRNAWQHQLAMQAQLSKRSQLGVAWAGQYARGHKDHGVLLTLNSRW